jgi:hypothetical protein
MIHDIIITAGLVGDHSVPDEKGDCRRRTISALGASVRVPVEC